MAERSSTGVTEARPRPTARPAAETTSAPAGAPRGGRLTRLAGESALYALGNAARRGFSMVTMPVFTRYLTPSAYGTLAIVGTMQNMLEVLYELGMGSAATRFYYDCADERERKRLFGTLLLTSLALTAGLTVVLLLAGAWLWEAVSGAEIPFWPFIVLAIATALAGNLAVLPRVLFRVRNQVPRFVLLSTLQTGMTVAVSLPLVVVLAMGALGPILATLAVTVLFAAVYAAILRPHVSFVFDAALARRALGFGLPDVPLRFSNWALKVADRLILQHFTSLSTVAVYSVGYSVAKMPFDLVGNGIHWAIVPFFYSTAKEETRNRATAVFARVATYNVLVLAVLGMGTVLFGRELILLLASTRYAEAERVLALVVAGSFLQACAHIPQKGIYLCGKTVYLPAIQIAAAAVNVGLNFLLIPTMGMMGAAWATVIAYAFMITATLAVSQAMYPIPYEWRRVGHVIAVTAALAAAAPLLAGLDFWPRVGAKAAVVAALPLLLLATGFFERSELTTLRARLGAALERRR